MKKYNVRIYLHTFVDYTVEANTEKEAIEMYSKCERLPFDMIDNETPDGLYVNLF
jgi:hypothetical protein